MISDQSATLQMSKVTGDGCRRGHTNAGSQLVRIAADPESSPERVPGNLFPSREIYFPGINNPTSNIANVFSYHFILIHCLYKMVCEYFLHIINAGISHVNL